MSYFDSHRRDLAELEHVGRVRSLKLPSGIDFSSNDYLGIASSGELRSAALKAIEEHVALGSGGSRLLRGNCKEHDELEAAAARFFGSESALFFATGYAANMALLSTLPQRGDLILFDQLVHASAHDGMKLSRARSQSFRHSDIADLMASITEWRISGGRGSVWIAVESLYSMDGDLAPLEDLVVIAEREKAVLLIDEAHSTGVYGPRGEGLAHRFHGHPNVVTLHTLGKALGCEGALVCGPQIARDYLVNRARTFIFSTAPSPLAARIAQRAIELLDEQPERRMRLNGLIDYANLRFAELQIASSGSQIIPVIIGDDAETMRIARTMQTAGFDVRGIRPPTVPAGTSRLRICITLNVTEQDIDALKAVLAEQLCHIS